MKIKNIRSIIISRTDAIGDVVLTLPMASLIKKILGEDVKVIFFGKTYTYPVINCCDSVDKFINYDTFKKFNQREQVDFLRECNADAIIHVFPRRDISTASKLADIPQRIGTTHRLYHWLSCNRLVNLGRKNSNLHEAQLNMRLLKPLGHSGEISLDEVPVLYNFKNKELLPEKINNLLSKDKFRLIVHPKSNASAREWNIDNYRDVIRILPANKFQFIITGGESETPFLNEWVKTLPSDVLNLAGKLTLEELIALIDACNGIIAASTGPLHIAAALGKYALGIYPPIRPMNPVRWAPVGIKAEFLVSEKVCSDCRNTPAACSCINDITARMVVGRIGGWVR